MDTKITRRRALVALTALAALPLLLAIGTPIQELRTSTTTCATTATELAAGVGLVSSMMIVNTSATAVFVGGSDVDGATAGTTGIDVCDGCTAGKSFSVDARRAWCVVAVGTQAVEVIQGR